MMFSRVGPPKVLSLFLLKEYYFPFYRYQGIFKEKYSTYDYCHNITIKMSYTCERSDLEPAWEFNLALQLLNEMTKYEAITLPTLPFGSVEKMVHCQYIKEAEKKAFLVLPAQKSIFHLDKQLPNDMLNVNNDCVNC